MPIIDTIKSITSGDSVAPEVTKAIKVVHAAVQVEAELVAKQTTLRKKFADAEEARDRYALDDDDRYKKLDQEAQRIDGELKKNLAALREAGRRKAEAEEALNATRGTASIAIAKDFSAKRLAAMKKIADGIALAVEGWREHHDLNANVMLWQPDLGQHIGGLLLGRNDVTSMVEQELWRLSAPPPLDGSAPPPFPGARVLMLAGNPNKLKPLVEVATEANDYLVRRAEGLKAQPVTSPQKVERPKAETPKADPQAETALPNVDASHIMAGLGKRRMS